MRQPGELFPRLFRVKICGITSVHDAEVVAAAGADAVGFNFYAGSKRYVSPETARTLAGNLPRSVTRVGVFVNADVSEIVRTAEQCQLDYVQLHGDEPPQLLIELAHLGLIRAFRCGESLDPVVEYLAACRVKPQAVLLDAYDPQSYGGTGRTLPWKELANASRRIGNLPVVLAGGLTPRNVAEAIRLARPAAVDTASGVETRQPLQKDAALCREFVAAAKSAFQV